MTRVPDAATAASVTPGADPNPGLASWLKLDPLSPFTAIMPIVVVVALQTSPVPALWTLAAGLVLLVVCDLRRGPLIAGGILLLSVLIASMLAVSAPIERVGASPVVLDTLGIQLQRNQLLAGVRLGGKLGAAMSLFMLTGLLATPHDLLRATVSHLRVPYKIAYAGLAALGFRERFSHEYRVIREAHMLRGTRAPLRVLRPLVRRWTTIPALMAGAIRHAERVSMSMDVRGFGAYPTRTERSVPYWRLRDTLLVAVGWLVAAYIGWKFLGEGIVVHDV